MPSLLGGRNNAWFDSARAFRCHPPPHLRGKQWRPTARRAAVPGPHVPCSSMEQVIECLATDITQLSRQKAPTQRHDILWLVVGMAGVPGSGKSTVSHALCQHLNATSSPVMPRAVVVGMDGYHLTRAQLDSMPDPAEAHRRRGAPWTFDGAAFVAALDELRHIEPGPVLLPSFDHGVGDPVPDDICVLPEHRIVIAEGNYLLLEEDPWAALKNKHILDLSIFLACDLDVAMARVLARQVGNGADPATAQARVRSNDRPNAELVAASGPRRADLVVASDLPWGQG